MIEVQVRADDDVDACQVEGLLAQRDEARVEIGCRRVQLRHAGVDQHPGCGMVDDMNVHRPALVLCSATSAAYDSGHGATENLHGSREVGCEPPVPDLRTRDGPRGNRAA